MFRQNEYVQMKSFLSVLALSLLLVSCHESLEDRTERETKEFTRKNCPMQISEYVVNDSMTFEKETRTIHYYYSMKGAADTTAIDKVKAREEMLKGLKNATGIRNYKKERFNFAYTYYSTKNKGKVLLDLNFTSKDYE